MARTCAFLYETMTLMLPTILPQLDRKKFALIGLGVSGVILYAFLNVWVFRYATSSRQPEGARTQKSVVPPQAREQKLAATPTPTPRPTGPGVYACSPEAACNLYSDTMRGQYCTTTYADSLCLDQCEDKAKQCTK